MHIEDTSWVAALYNTETGEIQELDTMKVPGGRWEKVFARNLAAVLDLVGDEKVKVLAYILSKKDQLNVIAATTVEISEDTGVSRVTVSRTIKALVEANYMHKIRQGKYRLSPKIMVNGSSRLGAAVVSLYEKGS